MAEQTIEAGKTDDYGRNLLLFISYRSGKDQKQTKTRRKVFSPLFQHKARFVFYSRILLYIINLVFKKKQRISKLSFNF